jgi:ATP-dependent DNA helicase RecG
MGRHCGLPQHRRARVFCRSEKGRFEVVFYQDPYTGERLREMGLNERQVKAVLYVKEQGSITNREFRELTGLSDEATRKDLAELTEKGLLRVEGKGRSTRYVFPKPGD